MQPEIILRSDVLDILFENRNKDYGAYTLRREYDARLAKAMLITFSLAALLLLLSFNFKTKGRDTHTVTAPLIYALSPLPKYPKKKQELKKHGNILPKRAVQAVAASVISTKPIVVHDVDVTNNIPKVDEIVKDNISTAKTGGAVIISQQNIPTDEGGYEKGNPPGATAEADGNNATPINNPDVYPDFPGGKEALLNFLRENLTNPKEMEDEQNISVKVRFVVNVDGSISGFDIMESGGDDFDKEVIRVLKKMPRWIPGKSNGHSVSVYYVVPVRFVTTGD